MAGKIGSGDPSLEFLDDAALQARRLAQLMAMTADERAALVVRMRQAVRLPRPTLHFRRHGADVGATTLEEYEQLFVQHIQRVDLRWFTFIRRREGDAVWYLIEGDSGAIAMYNEAQNRYWSFFCTSNLQRLLGEAEGWWVELVRTAEDWEPRPWR